MTTFNDIHSNALGYRDDINKLNQLLLNLSAEKAKGEPLVTWFRLRNRRIAQVLDPMKEELKTRTKDDKRKVVNISQSFFSIKKAKKMVESEQTNRASKLLDEITESIFNESIKPSQDVDILNDQIDEVSERLKSERAKVTNNVNYYASAQKNVDRVKELFSNTRTTKDIDIPAFTEAIQSINQQINMLDLNVPELKQLPETYDQKTIEQLHDDIRSVVEQIDSRYRMKLFNNSIKTIRVVIHDVGNDRGKKAFSNRSKELLEATNEAIDNFNSKYWQITGQRWERVGTNQWGYRPVKSTHPQIPSLN